MEKNVKVAKELLKLAKNLVALDEEGDGSGFQVLHDMNTNKINNINVAEENGEYENFTCIIKCHGEIGHVSNATFKLGYYMGYGYITWEKGTWISGTWYNGTWKNGTWKNGTWCDGTWENGTWEDGTWQNGEWDNGTWKDGLWKFGTWYNGKWENGIWKAGTFNKGIDKRGQEHNYSGAPNTWLAY